MSYIERKEVVVHRLHCSHPKVDKIWETGSLTAIPTDSLVQRNLHILLKSGERVVFSDYADGEAEREAEKYLDSL